MPGSNYSLLRELKSIESIHDKDTRYAIIFYDTLIGAYGARPNCPERFQKGRQITGKRHEAAVIAEQREETLAQLKKGDVGKVLEGLYKKAATLNGNINDGGFYSLLLKVRGEDLIRKVGQNLETELEKRGKTAESVGNTELNSIFFEESFAMLSAINSEIEKTEREWSSED